MFLLKNLSTEFQKNGKHGENVYVFFCACILLGSLFRFPFCLQSSRTSGGFDRYFLSTQKLTSIFNTQSCRLRKSQFFDFLQNFFNTIKKYPSKSEILGSIQKTNCVKLLCICYYALNFYTKQILALGKVIILIF